MESLKRWQNPDNFKFNPTIGFRTGARAGLWCGIILPMAMVLSYIRYETDNDSNFHTKVLSILIFTVSLYHQLFKGRLFLLNLFSIGSFFLLCASLRSFTIISLSSTVLVSLLIRNGYSYFQMLLRLFPLSFSVGEAILVVQGALLFVVSTIYNCGDEAHSTSCLFAQVLLLGICFFLILTSHSPSFQEILPFCGLFLISNIFVTFPLLTWAVKKNLFTWLFVDFIFLSSTRILLIAYWAVCTLMALTIVWIFGRRQNRAPVRLTILRKYFHGVVVAIYMPGILLDPELLFLASVVALCGFLFIEAIRLFNFEPIGPFLEKSLSQFLDSKDEGLLILTHIYLLVGCSLPIWIFPSNITSNKNEIMILSSGIISLGIGDTAASIGGSLWGRTKILNSPKSVEGATCSVVAEIIFISALNYFGVFGTVSIFPWMRFVTACVITSITEAVTTQVDNLVLPLVMYIVLVA